MKLLERGQNLTDLKGWMDEAAAGHGRLVFIAGEAGVGKTALLRLFAQSVEGIARVAVGACDPLSTPRPLGPLLDVKEIAPETTRRLETGAPRTEVFQAFLGDVAAGPTVVVFEDAQWADEATLDLLQFLGRRIHKTRTLLAVAFRDDEIDHRHPLTTVLGDLATAEGVRRMTLSPLSAEAVRILARGSTFDPAALYRQTGGNPFFVTEVLASDSAGIPVTVRDAVLARASRLSASGRRLLEAAAVVGVRVEPWVVREITAAEAQAIDECVAAGMLRPYGGVLAFRHELAREAILGTIPPHQSIALHRAALSVLRSLPATRGDLPRLAHHAEAAGDGAAVLEYAQEAARRAAALGAHREAASQYARALRFADSLPAPARADLLEKCAYQLFLAAQFPEAIETHERSLECRRASRDRRATGDSLRALSRILWCSGRIQEAARRAREAIALLEPLPPGRELALAYSAMSSVCMNDEDAPGTHAWGPRALTLGEQLGDTETVAHTLNTVGTLDLLRGVPGGREKLERSLDLALQAGLEEHVGRAFIHLGWAASRTRRFDLIERVVAGLAYAGDQDLYLWRLWLNAFLSRLRFDQGHWDDALGKAAFAAQAHGTSLSKIPALCVLALVRIRRGEPDARPLLDEAQAIAEPTHQLQHIAPVAAARAEAAWLKGEVAAIEAATSEAFDRSVRAQDPWTLGELGFWRWRGGVLQSPPKGAAEPFALMMAGRWTRAAQAWSEIGCPYEAATALAEERTEASLRRALQILKPLGARPMSARVARHLREMGVRRIPRGPRPSTQAHPSGLTSRELELVPLLVQGLSNGEIARRTYISVKTVDHHISSILSKLGVRRRVDVAREAARLGLTPEPAGAAAKGT